MQFQQTKRNQKMRTNGSSHQVFFSKIGCFKIVALLLEIHWNFKGKSFKNLFWGLHIYLRYRPKPAYININSLARPFLEIWFILYKLFFQKNFGWLLQILISSGFVFALYVDQDHLLSQWMCNISNVMVWMYKLIFYKRQAYVLH